jgi:hypothetical protein
MLATKTSDISEILYAPFGFTDAKTSFYRTTPLLASKLPMPVLHSKKTVQSGCAPPATQK